MRVYRSEERGVRIEEKQPPPSSPLSGGEQSYSSPDKGSWEGLGFAQSYTASLINISSKSFKNRCPISVGAMR